MLHWYPAVWKASSQLKQSEQSQKRNKQLTFSVAYVSIHLKESVFFSHFLQLPLRLVFYVNNIFICVCVLLR